MRKQPGEKNCLRKTAHWAKYYHASRSSTHRSTEISTPTSYLQTHIPLRLSGEATLHHTGCWVDRRQLPLNMTDATRYGRYIHVKILSGPTVLAVTAGAGNTVITRHVRTHKREWLNKPGCLRQRRYDDFEAYCP